MAAPKHWGHTRDKKIGDELLVSWCDGDLTAVVAREIDEGLLRDAAERAALSAYARACERSTQVVGKRDFIEAPRKGLVERCMS